MSLWRQLSRGLRTLVRREAADRDLADEVEHFLEQATADRVARGLSPEEASRATRQQLGDEARVREEVRGYGWENAVETLLADLRYGARRLRAAPAFTAVTTLTLALGIGATTAIASAVGSILLRPLPYPHADRITMIWDHLADGSRAEITFGTYRELAERARSFDGLAVMKAWQPTMTGSTEPERVDGQSVSAGYFRVLGVPPALGRAFRPAEDQAGGPKVVVLGDALWRRRFAADRAILGRAILLDGDPYAVIGVMPRGFNNVLGPSAEVWTPLQYDMAQGSAWGHHLRMVGRLRPGVRLDAARPELDAIARLPIAAFPRPQWASLSSGLLASPLQADVTRGARPALLAILAAVTVVLLIACVNVTNLILARGVHRRGELALRAALGAGRGRLIRQLFTEGLLLASLGGAAGVAVAMLGLRVLLALSPEGLPRATEMRFDGATFGIALALTTLVGLAIGSIPALQRARRSSHRDLEQGSRRTAGGQGRIRGALVVAEVALAIVLLVSSGLLLRSLQRLFAVPSGFDASRVLTLQIQTSGHRFDEEGSAVRFFGQALEAVRRVPGVIGAGFTSQLPMSGDSDLYGLHFDPSPAADPGEVRGTFRYTVTPRYLETLGVPLRRGRFLDERDRAGAPLSALVSETLARRRLPGMDPIGKRLRVGAADTPLYTIVGVVGDVKQESLSLEEADAVYLPLAQSHLVDPAMSLVVRTRGDAAALAPAVRAAVWSVDKDQPIVRVATMEHLLAASAAQRRFALLLFEAFALASLVLAAAGLYGVIAGSVAERRREIGVRSALGASHRDILAMVVRQGMRLTGLGVAIGVVGAAAATRSLVALLFGVSSLDPATYLGVVTLLGTVAMFACGVPAWRAAQVDPATPLRAE